MKIGVCTGMNLDRIRLAKEIGYDFAEGHCQDLVKTPEEILLKIERIGLPMLTANCFISLRVIGPEREDAALNDYLDCLYSRAQRLGIRVLVFGSSGARRIPDSMTKEEGRALIADFLREFVLPRCERFGIQVAIEPLRPQECNAINTVEQGVAIAQAINSPFIRVLADVKHMVTQGEDLDSLRNLRGMLVHIHTSNPLPDPSLGRNRTYPRADDAFSQASFLLPAIAAGVETCSIEADVIDFAQDARAGFETLKQYRN